jgi:hypothetical protein
VILIHNVKPKTPKQKRAVEPKMAVNTSFIKRLKTGMAPVPGAKSSFGILAKATVTNENKTPDKPTAQNFSVEGTCRNTNAVATRRTATNAEAYISLFYTSFHGGPTMSAKLLGPRLDPCLALHLHNAVYEMLAKRKYLGVHFEPSVG